MEGIEVKTVYFTNPGRQNTEDVFRIAKKRAEELGIKTIIVATTGGDTAAKAVVAFKGMKVIAVTHPAGFHEPNTQELTEENRKIIESNGGIILTATNTFGGLSRAMRKKFNMTVLGDVISFTLRILGQGIKVVCEISLMACDAGLVRTDEDVIVIGGTGRGADTAVVLKPAYSTDIFDMKIREILCKPHF